MKSKLWIVVLSLAIVGCDVSPGVAISEGQDMVASQLKDKDSAKFRNVSFFEDKARSSEKDHTGAFCGEVNAKNSFGGYTGYNRFTAVLHYTNGGTFGLSGLMIEEDSNRVLFDPLWNMQCRST